MCRRLFELEDQVAVFRIRGSSAPMQLVNDKVSAWPSVARKAAETFSFNLRVSEKTVMSVSQSDYTLSETWEGAFYSSVLFM